MDFLFKFLAPYEVQYWQDSEFEVTSCRPGEDSKVKIKEPATAEQPTWVLLVQVRVPGYCQTRPHCGFLMSAKVAVVCMLCCGTGA